MLTPGQKPVLTARRLPAGPEQHVITDRHNDETMVFRRGHGPDEWFRATDDESPAARKIATVVR
jgi:hypothetical protein